MDKDIFVIKCFNCEYEWEQPADNLGGINWICPKCNSKDETFLQKYKPADKDFYNRKVTRGRGGSLHA